MVGVVTRDYQLHKQVVRAFCYVSPSVLPEVTTAEIAENPNKE